MKRSQQEEQELLKGYRLQRQWKSCAYQKAFRQRMKGLEKVCHVYRQEPDRVGTLRQKQQLTPCRSSS